MAARGIRNNNPGNLRKSADKWQGLAPVQSDPEFFTFSAAVYGIRALARTLITYYDKYDLNTVNKVIARWAPPSENQTQAYANDVARRMGVDTGGVINLHYYAYLRPMVEAIIWRENGVQPYTSAQIDKALALAGVEPPKKPMSSSSTVQAGTVATASTAGAGVVETLQQAADQVSMLTPYLEVAKWAFLALTLAAVGFMIYRRWDDARRLAR